MLTQDQKADKGTNHRYQLPKQKCWMTFSATIWAIVDHKKSNEPKHIKVSDEKHPDTFV